MTAAGLDIAAYPTKEDAQIRKYATQYDKSAIDVLNRIKNEILGDFVRVRTVGDAWAKDSTMNDCGTKIGDARARLTGYWTGPAARVFNAYATETASRMNNNKEVTATIGTALMDCAAIVMSVYASCLQFIFRCAADLIPIGIGLATTNPATATAEIPYLISKVIDALSNFVKNVGDLIAKAVETIGQYTKVGGAFKTSKTKFQTPSDLPGEAKHQDNWVVTKKERPA